jgi:phage gp29-like protein
MAIVDIHGRPLEQATLREQQTSRLAQLHAEFAEHPSSGLTPPRLAGILRTAEQGDIRAQCELFQDMEEKDAHLLAEIGKRRRALTTVDWSVLPPRNPSAVEMAEADWLNEVLQDLPDFEDLLFDMLDAIGKGFSCIEMDWQRLGREWLPQAFSYREASWFQLDPKTRTELRLRDSSTEGEALNPFGWIVHTHKAKSGYIARGGLYRVLAWPYLFKNYAVRDLAEFLEIYGLPVRLGKYPPGSSADEKATLLRAVVSIGHNAAGIIPDGMAIDFKEAAKGTHEPFDWMVQWAEKSMSKAILGGTLTSQADGKSSTNALGAVHNEVRHDLLKSDAKQVATSLRQYLLYPLLVLNKGGDRDPRRLPRFQFDLVEAEDMATYAEALPNLVNAGMRIPLNWAHEKLRIPLPSKDDAVLGSTSPAAPGAAATRVAALKAEPEADPLDDLADQLASEWEPVANMMAPVQQLLASCKTLEEFRDRLPELVTQLDAAQVTELVTQGLFASTLAGRTGAI